MSARERRRGLLAGAPTSPWPQQERRRASQRPPAEGVGQFTESQKGKDMGKSSKMFQKLKENGISSRQGEVSLRGDAVSGRAVGSTGGQSRSALGWGEGRGPAHRCWGLHSIPALQPSWKAPDTQPRRGAGTGRMGRCTVLVQTQHKVGKIPVLKSEPQQSGRRASFSWVPMASRAVKPSSSSHWRGQKG